MDSVTYVTQLFRSPVGFFHIRDGDLSATVFRMDSFGDGRPFYSAVYQSREDAYQAIIDQNTGFAPWDDLQPSEAAAAISEATRWRQLSTTISDDSARHSQQDEPLENPPQVE